MKNTKILAGAILLILVAIVAFVVLTLPRPVETCEHACGECVFEECATTGQKACVQENCQQAVEVCSRTLPAECVVLTRAEQFEKALADSLAEKNSRHCEELDFSEDSFDCLLAYNAERKRAEGEAYCDSIPSFELKLECKNWDKHKYDEAIAETDEKICEEIIAAELKQKCIDSIGMLKLERLAEQAISAKDKGACEQIPDEEIKQYCITAIESAEPEGEAE